MERLGKILNALNEYDKYLMIELREPTDKNVSLYEHWIDCKCDIEKQIEGMKDLEKQGKLLKLPVPAGILVYEPYQFMGEGAWEIDVHKIRLEDLDKIGKTVFLTREEAEAALKEL